jgi:hypothetical protein
MILLIKIICGFLGFVSLYIAFFLYEDEEKKLNDRIQNTWLKLDETQIESTLKLKQIINNTISLIEIFIKKLFGEKVISPRTLWVGYFIIFSIPIFQNVMFSSLGYLMNILTLLFCFFLLFMAYLPVIIGDKGTKIGCVLLIALYLSSQISLYGVGQIIWPKDVIPNLKIQIIFFIAILISILIFCIVLRLSSRLLKIIKENQSLGTNTLFLIIIFATTIFFINFSYKIGDTNLFGKALSNNNGIQFHDLNLGECIDLFFIFLSFLSFGAFLPLWLFAVLLVLHPVQTVFWESLNRSIYSILKFKVFTNKKVLISVAVFLLTIAIPELGVKIKEIGNFLHDI